MSQTQAQSGETNLYLVSPPRQDATVDVVFIHGLGGDKDATWRFDEKSYWPEWIADDLIGARIWTAQYPAAPIGWVGESIPLLTVVFAMLDRFSQMKLGDRPIVLICHSLGGLVAKQMIRAAAERTSSNDWQKIGAAVKGVVFIATPHSGAFLATFLTNLVRVLGPAGLLARLTSSLKDLESNSPVLNQLSRWYSDAANSDGIATLVYYENKPVKGVGLIVSLDAVDPRVAKVTPIPLALDHWETAKPPNRNSQVYMGVIQFIEKVMSSSGTEPDLGSSRDPVLRLAFADPSSRPRIIPRARDHATDLKERFEEAISVSGLPTSIWDWTDQALAQYYKLAKERVKNEPIRALPQHYGIDVTDIERFAIDVREWRKNVLTNLVRNHNNETNTARTVVLVFEVENVGRSPAKNIEIELLVSSIHPVRKTTMMQFPPLSKVDVPVPPGGLPIQIAPPDTNSLNGIVRRSWYDALIRAATTRPENEVTLDDKTPAGETALWTFRSTHFDLRHGKSSRTAPLYVCFEYDPAHDIEVSYKLSAENQPEITKGKIRLSIEDG